MFSVQENSQGRRRRSSKTTHSVHSILSVTRKNNKAYGLAWHDMAVTLEGEEEYSKEQKRKKIVSTG